LYRRCSTQGSVSMSKIGRAETSWFLKEALLEEETFIPPDADRIRKLKALIDLVDRRGG